MSEGINFFVGVVVDFQYFIAIMSKYSKKIWMRLVFSIYLPIKKLNSEKCRII